LLSSNPEFHWYYSFVYIVLGVGLALISKSNRQGLIRLFERKSKGHSGGTLR
jgi:hypothetical protein